MGDFLIQLSFTNDSVTKHRVSVIARCCLHLMQRTFLLPVLLVLSTVMLQNTAHAAAGDLITTTSTIDYVIGGSSETTTAVSSFAEDRRINFVVADDNGGNSVPVISGMLNAVLQFTVTNLGNDVQDFLLSAQNTTPNPYGLPADNFDPVPASMQVFVESGATPGYQPAEDTAVYIDELAQNDSRTVYVVADMPAVNNDDVAAVSLIAQVAQGGAASVEGAILDNDDNNHVSPAGVFSNGNTTGPGGTPNTSADTSGVESVFNDPAGNAPEDISTAGVQDIVTNGQHSDSGAFQVSPPVAITKSVTVSDTQGGTDPHPGATLHYRIDVVVNGNSAVNNLVISDNIPANTTYVDGSIQLNSVAQTDVNDAPTDYSRAIDILAKPVTSIEVDLSQGGSVLIMPGVTNTITFEVTID
jgi:uncharacterized repeat protein (TIGR01451 family)